jgi:transposase
MKYQAQNSFGVPEETARVARAAFPKGNVYLTIRDELGVLYADSRFAGLFSHQGRPAESPGNLALVLVVQPGEGLSDRQMAEAVRSRIDLKYLLGLKLEDSGFDGSLLSDFRQRLLEGGEEEQLLNDMLLVFQERGWLKAGGKQRSDSTMVLAATRDLNRLELVGETMRQALEALAVVAPHWLRGQVPAEWFDRYSHRFDQYRLPRSKKEQQAWGDMIGQDGWQLLTAVYAVDSPTYLPTVEGVQILRQIWLQQYQLEDGQVRWRQPNNLPGGEKLIQTPYDLEARYSRKREVEWTGYKVHLSEVYDSPTFNIITHVQTTLAATPDVAVTADIHQALAAKRLLPETHTVDEGYLDADLLVTSREQYGVDLLGPVPRDTSWQAHTQQGFALADFVIDWQARQVTCPTGRLSRIWSPSHDTTNNPVIHVQFAANDCSPCPLRTACTRAKTNPRALKLRTQPQHEALQAARQRQQTDDFRLQYAGRAGVEGTLAQATRAFGLRRTPYLGLLKSHLHHVLIAASINLTRLVAFLREVKPAQTHRSRFVALAFS